MDDVSIKITINPHKVYSCNPVNEVLKQHVLVQSSTMRFYQTLLPKSYVISTSQSCVISAKISQSAIGALGASQEPSVDLRGLQSI